MIAAIALALGRGGVAYLGVTSGIVALRDG